MKKIFYLALTLLLSSQLFITAFSQPHPMVQQLADEASEIARQKGLTGDELFDFIENYISENMPQEIIEQEHEAYINSSYEEKLKRYNEWQERYNVYSYNSIVVVNDVGFIEDRVAIQNNFDKAFSGQPFSNDDRYLLKPEYDCITNYTLDGFLLTKTFDGQYSLFSIDSRDFITHYDKKYDLSCGNVFSLLGFDKKTVYDLTDKENLRLLGESPYCLPAKDNTTGKFGFIDWSTSEVVIPFVYDGALRFQDGVAAVKKGNYWGYIDTSNNVVLDFKYSSAKNFYNGIAQVDNSLIDKTGKVLFTTKNSEIYKCGNDYYIGLSSNLIPFAGGGVVYSIEVFDNAGVKLTEKIVQPNKISQLRNSVIEKLEYLGNGKLQITNQVETLSVDISKI